MIPGPIADDEVEATVARIAERGFVVHADAIRTASAFVARYQGQHAEYDDGDIAELENSPLADTKEEQVEKWRREVANVRARYGSSVSQGFARAAARAIEAGVKIAGKPRN